MPGRAAEFEAMAADILDEFQRVLIVDDVVAGLAYFHEDGKTDHLLHPARWHHRPVLQPAADDPRDHQRHVHPRSRRKPISASSASIC